MFYVGSKGIERTVKFKEVWQGYAKNYQWDEWGTVDFGED